MAQPPASPAFIFVVSMDPFALSNRLFRVVIAIYRFFFVLHKTLQSTR